MRGHILNVMMLLWKRALSCGSELVKSCERRVLWLWDGSGVQVEVTVKIVICVPRVLEMKRRCNITVKASRGGVGAAVK